jgi:hypothetical protein
MRTVTLCAHAAIAALQPPKLLLGTLAIAFIAVVGSFIDAAGGAHYVRGSGLDGPRSNEGVEAERLEAVAGYQALLPNALQNAEDPSGTMTLREVQAACEQHYLEERAALEDDSQRTRLESSYRETLSKLEALEPVGVFSTMMNSAGRSLGRFVNGVLTLQPVEALRAMKSIMFEIPARSFADHPIITSLIGLLLAFAAALFGGAIARLDALDTGLGKKPTAWVGLEYAWSHVGVFLQPLLLPLALVGVLAGLSALIGTPFNLPYLDVLGGLLYVIAIVIGIIASVLLLGFGLMAPMLIGSVAVERADTGDAIQRAWSVLFKRPAQVGLLLAVSLASFGVGLAVIDLVATLALQFAAGSWGGIIEGEAVRGAGTIAFLDFTFSQAPDTSTGSANGASAFIGFWETLMVSLILGYVFSWFATFGTRMFLAMRYLVDRQSISVIWVPGSIPGSTVRIPGEPEPPFAAEDDYQSGSR